MTSKFSIRLPKNIPLVALGATLFVLGGSAIAYLNFSQRAPRSLAPAGTQLVPKTAIATVTVTTDELTRTKLRQFGTADTQQQFDALLTQWKDRLFTINGYSYKRDIKPWIGDRVTLALLPANAEDPTAAGRPGGLAEATQNLVLVVPIADAPKAKALLGDGPANPGRGEIERRSYKGVEVQSVQTPEGDRLAWATIGAGWLLLGNSAGGIEQAIDTHKGGRSLLDNAGYRKAATRVQSPQPPGKNFAQFYLNIPLATQTLSPPNGNRQSSLIPLQGSEGLVATALIEAEGVRFEGTSWLSPKDDLAYSELSNEAADMPRRLPGDTLMMASGSNLQQFWQGFSQGNNAPPFFPDPQNLKAGLLTQTGLDIDEDVMPWAAGEFTLALLLPVPPEAQSPEEDSSEETLPEDAGEESQDSNESSEESSIADIPDEGLSVPADEPVSEPAIESAPIVMMVQPSDRQMAELMWSQLDDVMVSRYRYQVETAEFEGGSITEWISPFQGVQFSHGWLPGNVTFFAVGDGAAGAIAPGPERSLAESRLFQTLTDSAPNPNNGHFYIDLAQINRLEGVFPLPQLSADGPTAAIQSVGLTATVGDRTMDYDLYVKLSKAARPGPL